MLRRAATAVTGTRTRIRSPHATTALLLADLDCHLGRCALELRHWKLLAQYQLDVVDIGAARPRPARDRLDRHAAQHFEVVRRDVVQPQRAESGKRRQSMHDLQRHVAAEEPYRAQGRALRRGPVSRYGSKGLAIGRACKRTDDSRNSMASGEADVYERLMLVSAGSD